MRPATSIAELGLLELGTARLGFAPRDARPLIGAVDVPPGIGARYAYVEDYSVVLYSEEADVAGQFNIEIEQGATWSRIFIWEQENGQPVDMTGATAKLQVRSEKSSSGDHKVTLASYAPTGGDPTPWFNTIDINEEDGKLTCSLSPSDSAAIEAGTWFYDLLVTLQSGEVHKLVEGRAVVDTTVTA